MIRRLSKLLLIVVLITGWIFAGFPPAEIQIAEAVTTDTLTTSTTWTAPTGVTSVTAEVWGGGGGGGGENASTDGGGGGGGGAYSKQVVTVVPGNGYTVTVGSGGTGNTGCTASTAGGDSWFSTTGTVLAKGGSPGACSTGTPPAGGLGGVAGSGVGTTKFSGGQGEIGRDSNTGLGGYGGSSAGTAANGWSGPQAWSTATYPTASTPAGGGHGGDGGGTTGTAGSVPVAGQYGGGGGGAAEGTNIKGGNGANGKVVLTYNKPPNAPSQDSPANAATGVSVTPTFLMTATDADTTVDKLSYKVTIYSNSACTTVVQTNDQAVSSAGWTGTNATCTASPTACYTSGTQGSFLTQTALTASTQYWWKASAKDPDGNGSFTNSSTCNTFTTGAGITVSIIRTDAQGTIAYGSVLLGGSTSTDPAGQNKTTTFQNDGNVAEKFSIKTSTATGGTAWSVGTSAGSNIFVHSFATTSPIINWQILDTAETYEVASSSVAVNGTLNVYLKIDVPTASDYVQKTITVTVLAEQAP